MIATLRGTVQSVGVDYVVLSVGAVGVLVYVPGPLLHNLPPAEQPLLLYTHLVVREDALTLYGFGLPEQQAMFATLIGITGVGPRLALALLSTLTPEEIGVAVAQGNVAKLVRVPGIGKKLAERLVLELKGRLDLSKLPLTATAGTAATPAVMALNEELRELLVSLGYGPPEAQAAIAALPADAPANLEERLRLALRYFGGV